MINFLRPEEKRINSKILLHIAEKSFTASINLLLIYLVPILFYIKEIYYQFGYKLIIFSIFYFLALFYRKRSAKEILSGEKNTQKKYNLFFGSILATSILWGIGIVSILINFNDLTIILVASILSAGIAASALISLTASKLLMRYYFSFMLLPIIFSSPFMSGSFVHILIAITSLYYFFLMSLSSIAEKQMLKIFKNEIALEDQAQELISAKNVAIEHLSYKAEFLAKMSHELRTPLGGIIGGIELLRSESLSANGLENINILNTTALRLLELVNEILDASKINSGKMEIRNAPANIADAIEEVCSLYRNLAVQKKLNLSKIIDPTLVTERLFFDSLKLKQVLSNLISNGIKFTEKGEINLSVVLEEKTEKEISLLINIEDSGIGLTTAEIEKIFMPYEQIERISRNIVGTGLGLYISNEIVKKMGSQIFIESKIGVGTSFWFRLKLQREIEVAAQYAPVEKLETPKLEEKTNFNLKVLIIDDNDSNLIITKKFLDKLGCETTMAMYPDDGIEYYKNNKYDLVLLDINMPEKDGIQVLNEIKLLNLPKTLIAAFTANVSDDEIEKYLGCGFDAFLGKPLTTKSLKQFLKSYYQDVKSE